jgi:uncharacterized protein YgbK (DUF1537 family)
MQLDKKNALVSQDNNMPVLILSGSCSDMTLKQIDYFRQKDGILYKINPMDLMKGTQSVDSIWKFVLQHEGENVLLYSSDTFKNVYKNQLIGRETIANLLEKAMAEVGTIAVKEGKHHLIVAGGETSGAVIKSLNNLAFEIGETIAPGVPVLIPLSNTKLKIILKSGNFGDVDFFERANKKIKGEI